MLKMSKKSSFVMNVRKLPPVGSRVGVVCGPGERKNDCTGTSVEIYTDRWGTHAKIKMETGDIRVCEGLTEIGIGWYQL